MGRDRQFVDGEGRSELPRHTGVLVCKQNVRKTKQNKNKKQSSLELKGSSQDGAEESV